VTPHALGIMVAGGYRHQLIARNSTIPCSSSYVFTTTRDNQTSVKILVLQGDGSRAEDNELLGEFVLTGLRPARAGEVEVEVSFDITADGIVSVSARDLETGRRQAITVGGASGLTEPEIQVMLERARRSLAGIQVEDEAGQRRQEIVNLIREIEGLWPRAEPLIAVGEMGLDALAQASDALVRARAAVATPSEMTRWADIKRILERTLALFRIALRGVAETG
jgi:molecular chaperone DnaK